MKSITLIRQYHLGTAECVSSMVEENQQELVKAIQNGEKKWNKYSQKVIRRYFDAVLEETYTIKQRWGAKSYDSIMICQVKIQVTDTNSEQLMKLQQQQKRYNALLARYEKKLQNKPDFSFGSDTPPAKREKLLAKNEFYWAEVKKLRRDLDMIHG